MFEGADSGDSFDAADSGGDGFFADNFEDADVADFVDVRAAAKFLGVKASRGAFVGNGDDADVGVGIFVAEKGQRAGSERVVDIGDVRFDLGVVADFVVYLLFDVAKLFGVDVREVGKVKTQTVGRVERAGLLDVGAKNVAQGRVNEMRAGVIADNTIATVGIGDDAHAVSNAQSFFCHDFV